MSSPSSTRRDDNTVWVMPGSPAHKTWWRNLRPPGSDIELRLAGDDYRAHATALEGAIAPDDVAAGLVTYLAKFPRVARTLGISSSVGAEQRSQVERVAPDAVMVRIELAGAAGPNAPR